MVETSESAKAGAGGPPLHPLKRYGSVTEALVTGIVATVLALVFIPRLTIEIGAIGFFLTYLVVVLVRLPRMNRQHLRLHADESDTPGYVILVIALTALGIASGSLFVIINSGGPPDHWRMALGIGSVTLGWLCIHTMLAFHYAYEYYGTDKTSPIGKDGSRSNVGGLLFPGSDAPDGLSFLYFSFVIAMTAQVSDVNVTSNRMRARVLLHGILAFLFNTVILAIAVNVVVALAH